jgi:hypothetical protein
MKNRYQTVLIGLIVITTIPTIALLTTMSVANYKQSNQPIVTLIFTIGICASWLFISMLREDIKENK